MLPDISYRKNINITVMPSKTFAINFDKNKVKGLYDNLNSLIQTVYKILMTKRYAYEIYDWNYGIEISDLIGMPKGYVKTEVEKRIIDALIIDDRINGVYNFEFYDIKNDKCGLEVKFYVNSIFGEINFEVEV